MHTRRAIYRPSEQDRHPSSVTYHKQPTAQSVKQAHSFLEPNRSSFPPGFIFGTASAAYQYEGAAYEYGRGPCIWDTYTHKFPGNIADGSNGDVANDSYHKYKEDVRLMKEMGIDAYRFSISWSRLLPYGKLSKGVNEKGIMYYHNLLDELEANGIKPFVTLFHCDAPQYLQDEYDGFLSPNIVDDYRDYTDLCFREFGDKVKNWITFNEPFVFCTEWYKVGLMSAKKCHSVDAMNNDPATMPYLTAHHMLLAHAAAVDLYRKDYQESQNGIIGITLNTNWVVPNSSTWEDFEATQRAIDWMFGWFMDPVTYGDYPYSMQSLVGDRLPTFTEEQSRLLKGSYDFLGLNYYTSNFAADAPELAEQELCYTNDLLAKTSYERNGVPIGPKATSQWLYIYPKGLFDLLLYIKRKYKNPTIYITENGVDEPNDSQLCHEEALIDIIRVQYYHGHLSFLERAINKHGVNVKGYFAWSLLDNFEWETGYTVRFGLHYVDYEDGQKRYPKLSAKWFKKILQPKQANLKITM